MILSLLYRAFPNQFHKLVFESQRKPFSFEKLQFAFVDSNGKRYYRYSDDLDMPIVRKGYFEKCFMEFDAAISDKELKLIIHAMQAAIHRKDKQGRMNPDIAMIGHLITEMENRNGQLIHPEIMFDMVATLYIREDENPGTVDQEIHNQKVIQFKQDSQGGLYDFFYQSGLERYIPFSALSARDLEAILTLSERKVKAMITQAEKYISENAS